MIVPCIITKICAPKDLMIRMLYLVAIGAKNF